MGLFEQFPYSNFHELNLDWILRKIKEFGVVIDGLDVKIKDAINSGLKELDIVRLIMDAMTEYGLVVNVKAPPNNLPGAVGDGSVNDTIAIQGCIDYANANGGKSVYFPSGKYLTNSLTLKDNVSLVGFDRSTTHLVLSGGATKQLISGITKNNTISKLTLDGNMSIQVNDIDVVSLSGGQYNFDNIEITDGYSLMELNLNDYAQGSNIRFGKGVIDALVTKGVGEVNLNNLMFEELSVLRGRYIINNSIDNAVFSDINSICEVETAIKNSANNSVFIGHIQNATNMLLDSGADTYFNFYSKGGSVETLIDAEILARIGADNLLQDNIDVETLARTDAIDVEKLARISADNLLQDNINAEKLARTDVTDLLRDSIDAEEIARIEADSILQDNIDAEVLAIQNDITEVYNYVDNHSGTGDMTVHVKEYGAKCDGVTDDSSAIQQCLDSVPEGTTILVGNCRVRNGLTISKNITFQGENYINSNYTGAYATSRLFFFDGSIEKAIVSTGSINLIGVAIIGAQQSVGIETTTNSLTMVRSIIQNFALGAKVANGYYNKFNKSYIGYCTTGVEFDNCYNISFVEVTVTLCHNNIKLKNLSNLSVFGGSIEGFTSNGILLETKSRVNLFGTYFEGGQWINHGACVWLNDGCSVTAQGCHVYLTQVHHFIFANFNNVRVYSKGNFFVYPTNSTIVSPYEILTTATNISVDISGDNWDETAGVGVTYYIGPRVLTLGAIRIIFPFNHPDFNKSIDKIFDYSYPLTKNVVVQPTSSVGFANNGTTESDPLGIKGTAWGANPYKAIYHNGKWEKVGARIPNQANVTASIGEDVASLKIEMNALITSYNTLLTNLRNNGIMI